MLWNDTTEFGFLMIQRYDDVKELLGRGQVVNDHQNVFDPNMAIPLLPSSIKPPKHTKLRGLLNPFFSPSAVKRLAPLARQRAEALVGALTDKGRVDISSEFGIRYPTEHHLAFLGLPIEDGEKVLPCEEAIFDGFYASTPERLRAAGEAVASHRCLGMHFARSELVIALDSRLGTHSSPTTG